MLILDSNVWIHAVTIGGESGSLLGDIVHGNRQSAVSSYIHEEVRTNIDEDHSIDRERRNRALEQYFGTVMQCPAIQSPTTEDTREMDLEAEQEKAHNKLIGAFGDIQAKDAPILTLAYDHIAYQPTIVTNDEEFAALSPAEHGIREISVKHIELEWGRARPPAE